MTGPDLALVAKKLALIETCVEELRTLGHPERIRSDLREERFFEHTLQIAIQSILDVASHIVSERRLGEPRSNHELVDLLARHAWIDMDLASTLHQMIGFRNILVHGYDSVDLSILEEVVRNRLDDLLAFASAIRRRISHSPGNG
ncbi:MAG TPA: DUF86 domain-containing protein [Thermoanaerobaculia bacterium]|nr:DUF86 domain-containing protein [Thermoanaerobaculia bacterium]